MTDSLHQKSLEFSQDSDILVHYYPGNHSAPTQATRYIGKDDEITLPTGEKAKTKNTGILLFKSRHFYFPVMEEVEIDHNNHFFAKIRYWFKCIPSFIRHWWSGITIINDHNLHDNKSYNGFVINSKKSSLGQQTDIKEFDKSNKEIAKSLTLSSKPRIYFGVSRGAAATFSAIAEIPISQKISLCVLEAPPSSLSGVFKYYGRRYFNSPAFGKHLYKSFATLFLGKQHKIDKVSQARGHVDNFPDNIPLLIISSKKDTIVPHENTIRLALRVAVKRAQAIEDGKNGVAPVYFLQLEKVNHNDYATSGEPDSLRYRNTFHAICRKHDLPYIKKYADKGEHDMDMASLLTPKYCDLLKLQRSFWNTKKSITRNFFRAQANVFLNTLECSYDKEKIAQVKSLMHFAPLFAKKITPYSSNTVAQNIKINIF